jgi:hypothetical protein
MSYNASAPGEQGTAHTVLFLYDKSFILLYAFHNFRQILGGTFFSLPLTGMRLISSPEMYEFRFAHQ